MKEKSEMAVVDIDAVRSRMLVVRGQQVLLDRDVADLYGVQTKEINQAVRNDPDKFPDGFVQSLTVDEVELLRSQILTLENNAGRGITQNTGTRYLQNVAFICITRV